MLIAKKNNSNCIKKKENNCAKIVLQSSQLRYLLKN